MRLCARLDQSFHSLQHLITKKTWIFFRKLLAKIENVKNENRFFFLLENGNDIQCGEQVCVGEETQREVRGSSELFAPPSPLTPHTLPIQVNTLNIDTPK